MLSKHKNLWIGNHSVILSNLSITQNHQYLSNINYNIYKILLIQSIHYSKVKK